MKPRISLLTIGVDDLDRAVRFYRDGLGLPTKGIVGREFEHGAVAFFELRAGCSSPSGLEPTCPGTPEYLVASSPPRNSPWGTT